jgi:hypothetical protein
MKIKIILFGKHTNLLNQRKICIERKTAKQDIFFLFVLLVVYTEIVIKLLHDLEH